MDIRKVIDTVNRMQADGVIERYAIGGAVGATFYLEPVATLDVDVFVIFQPGPKSSLVDLEPIFKYLTAQGHAIEKEYVVVAGWPVQFLPPTSPLVEEAIDQAVEIDIDGTRAHVFTAEHLAAIALETGRPKDKTRLLQFIEEDALDLKKFQAILARHGLTPRWKQFKQQFPGGAP